MEVNRYYDIKKLLSEGKSAVLTERNGKNIISYLKPAEIKEFLLSMHPLGMTIKSVEDESVAQKVGFLQGDVIIAVDGEKVQIPYDFISYFRQKTGKKEREVSYMRGGELAKIAVPVEYEDKDNPYTGQTQNKIKWGD